MDRKTARKYVRGGKLPSELIKSREWKTHDDAFEEHWTEMVVRLEESPGLEAKTLFEVLQQTYPGRYEFGQLRTLQRRVKAWRASRGPSKDVVLTQRHRPGEALQTDFTWTTELAVTIAGQAFAHMLCVVVLPYSNWRWASVCLSESIASIRHGLQRALFQLGRVPQFHQTDNSTAATHPVGPVGQGRTRGFNEEYLGIMRHFGMAARTTEVGAKEQNGDVEAANGALKRGLEQSLLVRGSRDFENRDAWQSFVDDVMRKANKGRGERVTEELLAMRPLNVERLPEFVEERIRVNERSTIRVKQSSYSVPSRLIGEWVHVRIFEDRIVVRYRGEEQLACERVVGRKVRIDYRHVIWSLVRKPGGFARYVYFEKMFPSLVFRRAYDAIQTPHRGVKGDLEYLRILHLAASTSEADVELALSLLIAERKHISADAVKAVLTAATVAVPHLAKPVVDLHVYNALLDEVGT
jgi:hypothetical protein